MKEWKYHPYQPKNQIQKVKEREGVSKFLPLTKDEFSICNRKPPPPTLHHQQIFSLFFFFNYLKNINIKNIFFLVAYHQHQDWYLSDKKALSFYQLVWVINSYKLSDLSFQEYKKIQSFWKVVSLRIISSSILLM